MDRASACVEVRIQSSLVQTLEYMFVEWMCDCRKDTVWSGPRFCHVIDFLLSSYFILGISLRWWQGAKKLCSCQVFLNSSCMCTGMSVYRHVGINLSILYGVFTLCLNLVPQKEKVQFWLPRSQSGWGGTSCMEEPRLGCVGRILEIQALIVSGLKNPPDCTRLPFCFTECVEPSSLSRGPYP